MKRTLPLFAVILLMFASGCGSQKSKFIRLKKESPTAAVLYLLRPSRVPLAFWKQKILISKYEGSFQNSVPSPYREIALDEGEYIRLDMEEGYYRLESRGEEKILFLEKNKICFVDYYLFNESFFSFPELYFKELSAKQALEFLIEADHMDRHPDSTD
ncbi:hypothetical protein DLM76_11905 [Leptospira yasudae]|uniref:hypothetical protein n=1 Tax=Leptospira yasudae TaxID=2202201 RepID=UPI000E59EF65|nr:hypothetical protein [Leptospira yasudae]RHX93711.1 hypothetical protein DLM76_11905 [Leptospira yasudae]